MNDNLPRVTDVQVTQGRMGLWRYSYRLGNRLRFGPTQRTERLAWKALADDLAASGLQPPTLPGLKEETA